MEAPSSSMLSESFIISHLVKRNIQEENILNIYVFGSRIHGTLSANPDYDFLIVIDNWTGDDHIVVPPTDSLPQIDLVLYSPEGWQNALNEQVIWSLQCLWLPLQFILRERRKFEWILNKLQLRNWVAKEANRSFSKAHKKFIFEPRNVPVAMKCILHSIRIQAFAVQIATYGKITDYGFGRDLWAKLQAETSPNWEYYKKVYRPLFEIQAHELRLACPKPQTQQVTRKKTKNEEGQEDKADGEEHEPEH